MDLHLGERLEHHECVSNGAQVIIKDPQAGAVHDSQNAGSQESWGSPFHVNPCGTAFCGPR